MEILFAGTGSGKTSLKRFHSSFIIKHNGYSLLVDAGDGISRALLNINEDINKIDSIIFSHNHADHFAGIASLLTQMKLNGRSSDLTIFTHRLLEDALISFINHSYLFQETIGFNLSIAGFDFEKETELDSSIRFSAKQNRHITKEKYPDGYDEIGFVSSSFLFAADNRKIVYTADVKNAEDLYLFDENDIFITETTHVSLEEIEELYNSKNPGKLILTHISDEYEKDILNWYSGLSSKIKNKIIIAYDGLLIK